MISFGLGDSLLFFSSVSINRAKDQWKKEGGTAKAKAIGWCVLARLQSLGAVFASLLDTVAEAGRLVISPLGILMDGGFSKSSLSRIAKSTGAIAARTILRPLAAIGSLVSPEVTLGALHLSSHLDKLSLVYRMQSASLGVFNKEKIASETRSEATDLAFNRLERAKKTISLFPVIEEDTTSLRALTRVLWDKCHSKNASIEDKTNDWKKIVYSEIGSTEMGDPNRGGILLLEIAHQLPAVKNQAQNLPTTTSSENLWKAAFFEFLKKCTKSKYDFAYQDPNGPAIHLCELGLVDENLRNYGQFHKQCKNLFSRYERITQDDKKIIFDQLLGASSQALSNDGELFLREFKKVFSTVNQIIQQFKLETQDSPEVLLNRIVDKGTGGFSTQV